jgi:adenylate cyclase
MAGALGRLYRRMGRFYVVLLFATASILGLALSLIFLFVASVPFLGLSVATFRHIAWLAIIGVQGGTAVGGTFVVLGSPVAFLWMLGKRGSERAVEARRQIARMSSRHPLLGAPPIVLGSLPAVISLLRTAHPSWYESASIALGNCVGIALGVAIHMAITETLNRPVLVELDQQYPQTADEVRARTVSARPRIVISSLLVVWASGWLTAGLVVHARSSQSQLALAVFTGLAIAITFGLSLTFALSVSIFAPLRELVDAARRVSLGDLTTRVPIQTNDEISEVARSFNEMVHGLAEREALRSALGTYVEPSVATRLVAEGQILEGEAVDVTIMFVDIVSFSARAELMPPDDVCAFLNEFFGLVIPAVANHDGHTNKLLGDGLMAVFGAPVKLADHADRALAAAFTIQELLHERYRGKLRAGIGLNAGSVVVGTMGGGTKLDFTVVGDVVNVASRIEALTRQTQDPILLTEGVRERLTGPTAALSSRGSFEVRGRSEHVSVFAAVSQVPA